MHQDWNPTPDGNKNETGMADLSQVVLTEVNKQGEIDSLVLANSFKEDHQKIVGAIKSLQSLGDVRF